MDKKAELGLNPEPARSKIAHPRGGLRWAALAVAGSLLAACAQTVEVPSEPYNEEFITPDLLVTIASGTYRNISNREPDGLVELQTTCPTGTTFFWAHELSRWYKNHANTNPRGAYLAYGTYDSGKLKALHLAMVPTKPGKFEGIVILDCSGDNDEGETTVIKGRYLINSINR